MNEGKSHIDALRDAGFEIKSPLPEPYEEVIEGLSHEELKALIHLKERLDEAEAMTGPDAGPYREYFLPF